GDDEGALLRAQQTASKEDRLQAYAIIARARKDRGLLPDPSIQDEIKSLHRQLDPVALGRRAIDLASDLVHSAPDLAFQLVEQALPGGEDRESVDWTLARLSVLALLANSGEGVTRNAGERIQDPV